MTDALMLENMSPQLRKVAERARREPEAKFHSLAHLLDEEALERAFHRLRSDAAVGVDGVTKEQYGKELGPNLSDLHERMRTMRYRHQPILRKHIPKERSKKTRPIGISTVIPYCTSYRDLSECCVFSLYDVLTLSRSSFSFSGLNVIQ